MYHSTSARLPPPFPGGPRYPQLQRLLVQMLTTILLPDRLNMRRGLVLSALKQALIFGILVALSWSLNGVRMASIIAECPPPFHHHMMQHHHQIGHAHPFGRPFGPGFRHPAAAQVATTQAMEPK